MDDLFGIRTKLLSVLNPAPAPPGGRLFHEQNDPVRRSGTLAQPRAGHLATDRAAPAVDAVEEHRGAVGAAVQAVADRLRQTLDGQADVERQERLPLHLLGAQPPQLLRLVAPDLHLRSALSTTTAARRLAEDRVEKGVDVVAARRDRCWSWSFIVRSSSLVDCSSSFIVSSSSLVDCSSSLVVSSSSMVDCSSSLVVSSSSLVDCSSS